jgi:phage major head subunit gpT-like protein
MLVTSAAVQALQVTFLRLFNEGWRNTQIWGTQMATQVPSSTRSNTYGWMKRILKMRKWYGPRLIQNLSNHGYSLTNEPYELSIGVDRDDFEDDMLGVYNPVASELGRQSAKWQDQVLKLLLQSGTTGLGFDGQPFFSATHGLNPAGNQSNNFPVTPLNAANFQIIRSTMMAYTGEDGEPLGVGSQGGMTVVVPPALEDNANTVVKAAYNAAGATNVQMGQASVLVVPELANLPDTWYVADLGAVIKPLIFQLRKAPQLVPRLAINDDNVAYQRQFQWLVDARGVAGFGPWFLMARAKAT